MNEYLFFIRLFCLSPYCPLILYLDFALQWQAYLCFPGRRWYTVCVSNRSVTVFFQLPSLCSGLSLAASYPSVNPYSSFSLSLSLWRSYKTKMGAGPSSASSTQSLECQRAHPKSCEFENAQCLYSGMYCFYIATAHWIWLFNAECTSGFWVVWN